MKERVSTSCGSRSRTTRFHRAMTVALLALTTLGVKATDYVFVYDGNYLTSSIGYGDTFIPNTCIWSCYNGQTAATLGSTSYSLRSYGNTSTYLRGTNSNGGSPTTGNSQANWRLSDGFLYYRTTNSSTAYYLYYRDGWKISSQGSPNYNNRNSADYYRGYATTDANRTDYRATVYEVTEGSLSAGYTDFTISGDKYIAASGKKNYSHTNTVSQTACTTYTFNDLTYYSTDDSKAATTTKPGTEVTTGYTWSLSGANGYATVDNNGAITVSSIPDEDVVMTLTCTNNTAGKSASMTVTLTKNVPVAAGYVIYDGNNHYLGGTNTTAITSFNPNTCLWTKDNSNYWSNTDGGYLRNNNNTVITDRTDRRGAWTLGGTESGTTGQTLLNSTYYYLVYNNGWGRTTQEQGNRNVVFAVTKRSYVGSDPTTLPTISATRSGDAINFTHTNINGTYDPTYDDYIFYDNTHHYWFNNELVASAPQSKSSWTDATYTWSIVEGGDYVQINATSGVLTFKNAIPTAETTVKVRLTTSNISPMSDLTEDFTFTLTPNQGTLTVPTITGDDIITENGTYSYSATSTTTPGYSTVTGIGSNTYYVQNGSILTAKPTASTITYTYALSNNNGYATIDASTGAISVTNVPTSGDRQMTLTVTATAGGMTETATLPIHLTKENKITENTGMYVITYQNSHFLGGTSTADITSFNPATCLWTGTSGGKWKNSVGYYIANNGSYGNLTMSNNQNNGSNWTLGGTENGTTGRTLTANSYYSVRYYNSAWTAQYSNGTNTVLFAVTKDTYLSYDQDPLIEGDEQITDLVTNSSFRRTRDAIHNGERYVDYVFYNGNHHYFDMDGNAYTPTTFTYAWSLSDNADGYATIDAATGAITYTNYVQTDLDITVTLTATTTETGVSNKTATQTVTLKAPQNPTAITAQNVELAVGDPDYTLTYTLNPTTRVYNYVVASGNSDIVTVAPSNVTNTTNTGSFTIHPVSVGSTTLTLSAKKTGTGNAEEACAATVTITVKERCIRPTLTLDNTTGELTMTTTTEDAAIHYTVDGSIPTESSPVYDPDDKPVLTATTTVRAIATKDDMLTSAEEKQTFEQIPTPTLTPNSDGTITLGNEVEGVTYHYTTDGTDPTLASASTTGTVSGATSGSTVKVIAVKEGMITSLVGSREIRYTVATPVITIDGETGVATITCATPDATIHYTTDNSEPTSTSTTYTEGITLANGQTVKAIAYKADYNDSDVASERFMIPSGVSDEVVTLNDYEDHTWTYYAGVDASVDGGYYNETNTVGAKSGYTGKVYSPNPRNVKITYYGNSTDNIKNGSTVVGTSTNVKVGIDADANTFVYYKTIEKRNDKYTYRTIPNPFSVRPKVDDTYYGFSYWRVKSVTGGAIADKELGSSINAETEITFVPDDAGGTGYTANCTSMEVELEAVWEPATVITTGTFTNTANRDNTSRGTVERNFFIVSGTGEIAELAYPCTYTSLYPNGTTNGTAAATSVTVTKTGTFTAEADSKIEYVNLSNGSSLNGAAHNFTLGRGIGTDNKASTVIYGSNANVTNPSFHCRVESGKYDYMSFAGGYYTYNGGDGGSGRTITVDDIENTRMRFTMGCDYDRALGASNNGNDKLILNYAMSMGRDCTYSSANQSNPHTVDLVIKSGKLGDSQFLEKVTGTSNLQGGAGYGNYISSGGSQTYVGGRNVLMEGGETSTIGSGIDRNNVTTSDSGNSRYNDGFVSFNVRITGGIVHGNVYGGAAKSPAGGDRVMVVTGGQVKGWFAAGCNGTSDDGGQTYGTSWVYIGGTGRIDSEGSTKQLGYASGGNVYAAGAGRTNAATCGEMTNGTNLVIADESFIERGAYGGGNYGYAKSNSSTNIYITGGTNKGDIDSNAGNAKGGVYGGANQQNGPEIKIWMTGGKMLGGVYGGCNTKGTIAGDVTMKINGGQVGTSSAPANIHGGGYGQLTVVNGTVNVALDKNNVGADTDGAVVWGDVYGGSALGQVNATATVGNTSLSNIQYKANTSTNVTLNAGTINGSLYGGALGSSSVAANVYGPVAVKVYGGSVKTTDGTGTNGSGAVYGANNVNGAPQRTVTVDIYGTDAAPEEGEYALFAVYGGGNHANYTYTENGKIYPQVTIHNCDNSIEYVYGGGNQATVPGTQVKVYGGNVIGNVFGGGNNANVTSKGTDVDIYGGTILNVFGGNNNGGSVTGNISVTVDAQAEGSGTACTMALGNVYGGGNIASYTGSPVVDFINGTSTGSVFGGGRGKDAVVVGNPTVNIGDWDEDHSAYVGGSVFGGGDLAAVEGNPTVTIRDCGTIIGGDLYGGGNAAPVYSTNTTMWGGTVKGNVFGGGNGSDPTKNAKGAQVGYKSDDATAGTGDGNAVMNIFGGTIGTWEEVDDVLTCTAGGGAFGGSNTNGNIRGKVQFAMDEQTCTEDGAEQCDLKVKEVYGAGNEAVYMGSGIDFNLGCVTSLGEIYGGAKAADLTCDVNLKITSGHFGKVFGGNNISGKLNGEIVITVDETGCNPVTIGELYGGGNMAAYSIYGYEDDGTVKTSGTELYDDPVVNIVSCTSIGTVYGGGLGSTAVMVGNPKITVQQVAGEYDPDDDDASDGYAENTAGKLGIIGTIFGGGNEAEVKGTPEIRIATEDAILRADGMTSLSRESANIHGNVYGGGNKAKVTGDTKVVIGPEKTTEP